MNREPTVQAAAVKELVSALVKALVIFGVVVMTTEQFGVLMILVDAFLGTLLVLFVRPRVTPTGDPKLESGTTVTVTNQQGTTTGTTTV